MKSDAPYSFSWEKFASMKEVWKQMETPSMSPYLHYDYVAYIERYTRLFTLYRPRVGVFRDAAGEPLMLVPLKGSLNFGSYRLLADIQGSDRCDAMYRKDLSIEERERLCSEFYSIFRSRAKLYRLQEGSPLLSQAPEDRITYRHTEPYVRVEVLKDWDGQFGKLSRGVRQNVRTAYNRMRREGKDFKLEVFDSARPVDGKMWKKIMDLYFERLFSRYESRKVGNFLDRFRWHFNYFHLKHDSLSLRHLPNSFLAVLLDGDAPVAFLSGLFTHDRRTLTVPRLAMDEAYAFYSPGYLLLCETLRYLGGETSVSELDLSRGDEKYKFDMGGTPYKTTDIHVCRSL